MEDSHENENWSDLMACHSNKREWMTLVDDGQNDCCFNDSALVEMQHLKHE